MTLPEFRAWQRFAFKRAVERGNARRRAEWRAKIEALKRRGH